MTDIKDDPACWGNVGQTRVDLFAPGVAIYSTVRGRQSGCLPLSGTSMAAPMVAGAAAVAASRSTRRLARSAGRAAAARRRRQKSALEPSRSRGGRLNAARAAERAGRLGSGGGESRPWVTCDRDHDGVRDDAADKCPDTPGTPARRLPGHRRRRRARQRRQLRERRERRSGRRRRRRRGRRLRRRRRAATTPTGTASRSWTTAARPWPAPAAGRLPDRRQPARARRSRPCRPPRRRSRPRPRRPR